MMLHLRKSSPAPSVLIGTYNTRDMAQAEASIHNGTVVPAPDGHRVYVTSPWVQRNLERRQHVHEIDSAE